MVRIWIAIGVVLAVMVSAPPLSAADDDNGRGGGRVLHFVEVPGSGEGLDLGKTGESVGDLFVYDNVLKDPTTGSTVGRFAGTCMQMFVGARCEATMLLAQGTLELAGAPDFTTGKPIHAAVLGGTGRYRGAGGEATFVLGADSNQLTVRLTDD